MAQLGLIVFSDKPLDKIDLLFSSQKMGDIINHTLSITISCMSYKYKFSQEKKNNKNKNIL